MVSIMAALFSPRIITVTSKGNLGGRVVKESGRGRPGPDPEILGGLPADR